ncbi:hypothetical protein CRG98_026820 [Punica granatum]|uniref:Uncharacterized protein n=1 Tax=Punica granatum TaxID=22663 RepID=A0A2I0J964_PUNGR|nr:hypothetical protein CRG98_026820 [Punica granatum]
MWSKGALGHIPSRVAVSSHGSRGSRRALRLRSKPFPVMPERVGEAARRSGDPTGRDGRRTPESSDSGSLGKMGSARRLRPRHGARSGSLDS